MDKREQMLSDWKSMEMSNNIVSGMPMICSEGNGCVYRMDAFVNDWRDNPNDLPNRVKAPYASFVWNRNFSKHYPTPQTYWNVRDTRAYKYMEDKKAFDKAEQREKEIEEKKYMRVLESADKRPLHRSGSLNRAFFS